MPLCVPRYATGVAALTDVLPRPAHRGANQPPLGKIDEGSARVADDDPAEQDNSQLSRPQSLRWRRGLGPLGLHAKSVIRLVGHLATRSIPLAIG